MVRGANPCGVQLPCDTGYVRVVFRPGGTNPLANMVRGQIRAGAKSVVTPVTFVLLQF